MKSWQLSLAVMMVHPPRRSVRPSWLLPIGGGAGGTAAVCSDGSSAASQEGCGAGATAPGGGSGAPVTVPAGAAASGCGGGFRGASRPNENMLQPATDKAVTPTTQTFMVS
jgi:hypothetical protein